VITAITQEFLILTKTYPAPSAKYRETTCVAAVNRDGELRRLFPIPFRLLDGEHQFTRWEWITARAWPAANDRRPESFRIDVDSIVRQGVRIGTSYGWRERKQWIEPHVLPCFRDLEERRAATGETLGFLRPKKLIELQITPLPNNEREWTDTEKAKLAQDGLFDSADVASRLPLEKVPYDFHYRYECETADGAEVCRHKITDWEAGVLYRKCLRRYGAAWESKFRQKLEAEFAQKDLILMMGTMHRFPDQWLIVGLVYPPKSVGAVITQPSLDLGL
jgi:hypothetical protein